MISPKPGSVDWHSSLHCVLLSSTSLLRLETDPTRTKTGSAETNVSVSIDSNTQLEISVWKAYNWQTTRDNRGDLILTWWREGQEDIVCVCVPLRERTSACWESHTVLFSWPLRGCPPPSGWSWTPRRTTTPIDPCFVPLLSPGPSVDRHIFCPPAVTRAVNGQTHVLSFIMRSVLMSERHISSRTFPHFIPCRD